MAKTREAKPGELREIKILELLEKFSKRPETRMDVQRILEKLSPTAQIYIKHLVMSGTSSLLSAARATGLKTVEIEVALDEIEKALLVLRR